MGAHQEVFSSILGLRLTSFGDGQKVCEKITSVVALPIAARTKKRIRP